MRRRGQGSVTTDLASVDTVSAVAENDRGEHIEDAKSDGEDSRRKNEAPDGQADVFLLVCRLNEVCHDVAADDEQGKTEPAQRVLGAKDGEVPCKPSLEETDF